MGNGYANLVKASLGAACPKEYEFINRGLSGNRIVDVYARIKADFINLNPDYASIYVGVNDTWHEIARKNGVDTPVLMLTAKAETEDKIAGLDAGADDYVTKPCSPSVLMKRLAALLRRGACSAEDTDVMAIDELKLDTSAHEVWLDGQSINLTLKEYSILQKFLAAPGRVFSREQLLDDIWGFDFDGDVRTVDSHVARLRGKLGTWGVNHLKTIYGIGYKIEVN